jgi:hypothetical protein
MSENVESIDVLKKVIELSDEKNKKLESEILM